MGFVAEQLKDIKQALPAHVTLVAVSKTHPAALIQEAYDAGQRDFGENRVQELVAKQAELPNDIRWHLIGHLQRNKVKLMVPFVHLVHSIDSERLLQEVNKEAAAIGRVINVLLQFHIAKEESKFGFDMGEAETMLWSDGFKALRNVRVVGVMGMATFTEDTALIKSEFKRLKKIFDQLKDQFFSDSGYFQTVSMGMSSDYLMAVEEGSTMVRVGSSIFGKRG
jgi:pyridoxal phosphate enzyme (YggS family)